MRVTDDERRVEVFLLCGGLGTRLRPVTKDSLPKSLWRVGGKELIRYTLDTLEPSMIGKVVFCLYHQADILAEWVNRQQFKWPVEVVLQSQSGITAALATALSLATTPNIVIANTDEIRDGFDFASALTFHNQTRSLGTVVATYGDRLFRHRTIITNADGLILESVYHDERFRHDLKTTSPVNAGLYFFDTKFITRSVETGKDWIETMDEMVAHQQLFAEIQPKIRFFNVGTPDELKEAEEYMCRTIVSNKS